MRKFMLGVMVGVAITAAGSAYADDVIESIVGKTIQGQFPVKIEGKQLDTQAAVVDGTSYLPVRAIGEALNMEVSFNADLGIELKEKGGTNAVTTPSPVVTSIPQKTVTVQEQIDELNKKITDDKALIETYKAIKKSNEAFLSDLKAPKESVQQAIDSYVNYIKVAEARIADYESQLAALQAQQ